MKRIKVSSNDKSDVDHDWVDLGSGAKSVSDNDGTSRSAAAVGMARSLAIEFLPENRALNSQLMVNQQLLVSQPAFFFQFVAEHTNSNRIEYSLRNLLAAITEMLTRGNFSMVLQLNGVHCTQAVDRTLAQFADGEVAQPRLFQVAERGAGAFLGISKGADDAEVTGVKSNELLQIMEAKVEAGSRACICVPVAGRPFSHAMNYVHLASGERFIICGQQQELYNLQLPTDVVAFNAKYNVAATDVSPRVVQVVVTGAAPSCNVSGISPTQSLRCV